MVTAMKLFIRIYFGLQTHLQLITKKYKGNFIFTIYLKNSILTLKLSILTKKLFLLKWLKHLSIKNVNDVISHV